MTREILLIQVGLGGVGRELARQVLALPHAIAERDGFRLSYLALADSSAVLAGDEPLIAAAVQAALDAKQAGQPLASLEAARPMDWYELLPDSPCIVVDVTAGEGMETPLQAAVAEGHRVVLANKKPLTADLAAFRALTQQGRTRYEATVGAGLPLISTLRALLDSGDTVERIEASMSGTLGYLCAALEGGTPLSQAVQTAHANGWTEPDPRDDLSGADVARKALILARTLGLPWSLDDVPGTPWFPPDMARLSRAEFLQALVALDEQYATRVASAATNQTVLRYVATLETAGQSARASIDLRAVPLDHPLAALRGPDNLFAFTTQRYAEQPLVVRGPGAGVAVTAAGVLADCLATAREM